MPTTERITVILPTELVASIDHLEKNRSRFILEAVEHELGRRRGQGLLRSLANPHSEAADLADEDLIEWGASLPTGDEGLVDLSAGKPVRPTPTKLGDPRPYTRVALRPRYRLRKARPACDVPDACVCGAARSEIALGS